jgi:hypothetical protein
MRTCVSAGTWQTKKNRVEPVGALFCHALMYIGNWNALQIRYSANKVVQIAANYQLFW